VENWLAQEGFNMASPPDLSDLALAPRSLFNKVYGWLSDSNTRRRNLALSASVRRAYAPLEAAECSSEPQGVEALTFPGRGKVVACVEAAERVVERLKAMSRAEGVRPFAIEVFVPVVSVEEEQGCTSGVEAAFRELLPASRVTLTFLYP